MKTLKHGDLITLNTWTKYGKTYAKVGALNGYCEECGYSIKKIKSIVKKDNVKDLKEMLNDLEHTSELAWTTYCGTMLSSDPSYYEREMKKAESAIVISKDEIVQIECKEYRVVVVQNNESWPRNSDPIKFVKK